LDKGRGGFGSVRSRICLVAAFSMMQASYAADHQLHSFQKIQLTDKFWAEGVAIADVNRDGHIDIISGPYWYEGPDFKKRHQFYPATQTFLRKAKNGKAQVIRGFEGVLGENNSYSNNFFTFVYDFNHDGWPDILTIGFPGAAAIWYQNPGERGLHGGTLWQAHVAFDPVDNESPTLAELFGDGRPVLLCMSGGFIGYASPNPDDPAGKWTFHPISPKGDFQQFTHGLGYGDVNGDGRADILEANGWWEQPAVLAGEPVWRFHRQPFNLGGSQKETYGGSQMYTYDVNGDGLPDVITVLAAHNYGLVWYQQLKDHDENGEIQFKQHFIINRKPSDNTFGVAFSEMHAVALADMDGEGLQDIVTGKRFWAHGSDGSGFDDDPNAPAVLYWFKLVRNANHGVEFIPYLVDDNSGVGTQIAVGDVNGDGLPDIVVSNKKGTFVFLQKIEEVSQERWDRAQPKPKFTIAEGGAH
jgi:hypothetical protein